jgi:putative ABC transport system ATP-binding protein
MMVISNLSKTYASKTAVLSVLQKVSLTIQRGELCAITGASGSGKTTLMNLMGLLDRPDAGRIAINGIPISELKDDHVAAVRNRLIGFVFQSFHLLANLTALDNVALPLIYRGISLPQRRAAAAAALGRVGLEAQQGRLPDQLSGGQKQRVAIARALVGSPALILADEPTGNLDSVTSDEIMNLFLDLNRSDRTTLVLVTHDPSIAARCPRRIIFRDGRIVDDNRGELRDATLHA